MCHASATVLLCYAGEPGTTVSEADAAIEPLLELGTVTAATIAERRYSEILEDAAAPTTAYGSPSATPWLRRSTTP